MLGPQFVVPHFPLKSWFGASRTLNQFKSSNTFCFCFRIRRKTQKSCRINPLHSASWEKLCNWVARQLCFSIQHFYLRFKMLAKYSLCTCVYPCTYFCCNLRVKKKNNIDWIAAIPAHWGFFSCKCSRCSIETCFLSDGNNYCFIYRTYFFRFFSFKKTKFVLFVHCLYLSTYFSLSLERLSSIDFPCEFIEIDTVLFVAVPLCSSKWIEFRAAFFLSSGNQRIEHIRCLRLKMQFIFSKTRRKEKRLK